MQKYTSLKLEVSFENRLVADQMRRFIERQIKKGALTIMNRTVLLSDAVDIKLTEWTESGDRQITMTELADSGEFDDA